MVRLARDLPKTGVFFCGVYARAHTCLLPNSSSSLVSRAFRRCTPEAEQGDTHIVRISWTEGRTNLLFVYFFFLSFCVCFPPPCIVFYTAGWIASYLDRKQVIIFFLPACRMS